MSTQLQPAELRRHLRVEFSRRAWCEHRDWTLYLPLANVSQGGLFVQTSTPFASGELLRVCLSDRDPVIVMDVEVMWSSTHAPRVGIGCAIRSFVQGASAYTDLVEQLTSSTR